VDSTLFNNGLMLNYLIAFCKIYNIVYAEVHYSKYRSYHEPIIFIYFLPWHIKPKCGTDIYMGHPLYIYILFLKNQIRFPLEYIRMVCLVTVMLL